MDGRLSGLRGVDVNTDEWLFVIACVLAAIGATLSAVVWLAKEALEIIAGWFLGWDKGPRE